MNGPATAQYWREDDLMEAIRVMTRNLRLNAFHPADSRRSWGPGYPDLTIAGPGGCLFRECKTERGSLRPEQRAWGYALAAAGMDWRTWRPRDLLDGSIANELAAIAAVQPELFPA